jgi:hypothetical protein
MVFFSNNIKSSKTSHIVVLAEAHQVLFSFFLHYCHCDSTIKQIAKEQNFYTFKSIGNEELVREHALSFLLAMWFRSLSLVISVKL